ncbi:MAG: hypothetical protein JWO60_54 [Frankiales bacterium]|nr:hypothetical protein [Frankiales bacterium]
MDDDPTGVRHMPGPVRPQWGELDAVLRAVLVGGGDRDDLLRAADEVALEEDLDPRRAADRAAALWEETCGADDD